MVALSEQAINAGQPTLEDDRVALAALAVIFTYALASSTKKVSMKIHAYVMFHKRPGLAVGSNWTRQFV